MFYRESGPTFWVPEMNYKYCRQVWKLIREEDLNITIVCSDGTLQTNKCFSEFFRGQLSIIKDIISDTCESEMIYLPDFNSEEVNFLLSDFSTFSEKKVDFFEESPALNEIIDSPGQFEYSDQAKLSLSHALTDKALECTTHRPSPAFKFKKNIENCKDTTEINVSFKHKLHICYNCGASFHDSKNLAYHRYLVHPKNEDSLQCEVCLKKFPYKHVLNKHFRRQHSGSQFFCSICNNSFTRKTSLSRHTKKFHA